MKGSTSERTVEAADVLVRENEEILQNRAASPLHEVSLRYLETILTSVEHAGALLGELLDISRMGRVGMRNTNQPAGKVLDEVNVESTGLDIHWEVDVRGFPSMLQLVTRSSLSNAVKYSLLRDPAIIKVWSISDERGTVSFVRDNGVGFDIEYADKRLGLFQRLHDAEEFEGTGIGLASVRRIADSHAGRGWVEGCVGKGATSNISLPRSTESIDG